MNFGRVVGRVVATRRAPGFTEPLLLLLQPLDEDLHPRGIPIVAVDPLQTGGLHDLVFYVSGSDATGALDRRFQPVDAAVVGFVDGYTDMMPAAAPPDGAAPPPTQTPLVNGRGD